MESTALAKVRLRVSDTSGQRTARVNYVPPDSTVGELVSDLVARLGLSKTDVAGRPLAYQALDETNGKHLHASDRLVDAVEPDASIVLAPNVTAGGRRA